MAQLSAVLALSHAPGLTGWIDQAETGERERLLTGYQRTGELFRATRPDIVIGVANDHCLNLPVDDVCDFCVGVADRWKGPAEWFRDWLNVPDYEVKGDGAVGTALSAKAIAAGYDFRTSSDLLFDDNWSVPLLFLTPEHDVPLVPIHMNCIVPPLIEPSRCLEVGRLIGRFIAEDLPDDMRVAFMATGGLSHDPGGPKYFQVDEDFDRWFLGLLEAGDPERVVEEVTLDRMAAAGDGGTTELLSWIVAMGVAREKKAQVLCYEPSVALRCGMGSVHWDLCPAT